MKQLNQKSIISITLHKSQPVWKWWCAINITVMANHTRLWQMLRWMKHYANELSTIQYVMNDAVQTHNCGNFECWIPRYFLWFVVCFGKSSEHFACTNRLHSKCAENQVEIKSQGIKLLFIVFHVFTQFSFVSSEWECDIRSPEMLIARNNIICIHH